MGLFDFKLVKKNDLQATQEAIASQKKSIESLTKALSDIKLSVQTQSQETKAIQEAIKEKRRTLNKPLHYRTQSVSGDLVGDRKTIGHTYYGPGYDLSEIGRAIDVEPYINQSVRKHREQILKEGFGVNCDDDEIRDYLNQRLFEMFLVSGITTDQWVREFTTNLVAYGTAFLVIKRDGERSSGKKIRIYGKDREPMAAVYPMDPTTVSVALNDYGHPIKWKQRVTNAIGNQSEIVFDADDVIVATIDKKSGFVFGTPYIMPTLDDVRSLRRLEEFAELLVQRNCFPLLHFKVGTDDTPAQVFDDGTDEISFVRTLVESMPSEGGIVTSSRVEGVLLGGEKQTLDLVPYLEYFEARVQAGLRLSDVDLGRGDASKASAVTVSQGLQDAAKDFQAIIGDVLISYLLIPLALEGGFDISPVNENVPTWEFSAINAEEERANQAHGQDMFLGGTITHDEFRKDYLGKKALSEEDQNKLHPNMEHQRNKEVQEIAGEQAIAKAKVSKSATAAKNKSKNKTRPANQHGRKSTKTRVTKNSLDLLGASYSNMISDVLSQYKSNTLDLMIKHEGGVVSDSEFDLSTKQEEIQAISDSFFTNATIEARKALEPVLNFGAKDALTDLNILGDYEMPKKYIDRFFKNYVEKTIQKLISHCQELINNNDALSGLESDMPLQFYVNGIFDELKKELKDLTDKQLEIAYRVGYARAARSHGISTIILTPDEDGWYCEDCEDTGPITVSLLDKNSSYPNLVNTHGDCDFTITIGEK